MVESSIRIQPPGGKDLPLLCRGSEFDYSDGESKEKIYLFEDRFAIIELGERRFLVSPDGLTKIFSCTDEREGAGPHLFQLNPSTARQK
jgi:hypothetical protein